MGSAQQVEWTRPKLYTKQLHAVFNPCRFSVIESSTKAGKTAACIAWLVELWFKFGEPGREFWWIAPVHGQAKIAYNRIIRGLPRMLFKTTLSPPTITNVLNGAKIVFKSADKPDSLYGEDVYAAVIDEATRCKEEAWYAIRTTITATRAPCRIIGNVKGRQNWVYRLARRAEAGRRGWSYHKITAWDAVQAGVLSRQEILDAKEDLPEDVFRELYLAEPTDTGANPFGHKYIQACSLDDDIEAGPSSVWGWDLGRKIDWTVGTGLDDDAQVSEFIRFRKDWPMALRLIVDNTNDLPALVDETGLGDPVLGILQGHSDNFEGFIFSAPSKQQLIESLVIAVQRLQTKWNKKHVELIRELNAMEYLHTRTGIRYGAPEGEHDDCVMSLALAYRHLKDPKSQGVFAW